MLRPEGKRFVMVQWRDPNGGATAASEHDLTHAPTLVCTSGWELRSDAVGISIGGEYCGDGTYRDITFVMPELIDELVEVKIPKRRKRRAHVGAV